MKIRSNILCLILFSVIPSLSLAHEQVVHEEITAHAAAAAAQKSFCFKAFLNTVSNDCNVWSDINSMITGSFDEDLIDYAGDVGGKRSYNHFYDPLTGLGLSDWPPDIRMTIGTNSFSWASVSNCPGLNFYAPAHTISFAIAPLVTFRPGSNINTSNIWSWQNARAYEYAGLVDATQNYRSNNLICMFRALGQVMHLLQDTTQPQHVRNEQHVFAWDYPFYLSYLEHYGGTHWPDLNYGDGSILDWEDFGFTNMQNFWNREFYTGNNSQALDNDASGGTQLGLAEFSNGNFIGQRHQYAEYYLPGDIRFYPFPSILNGTDYRTVKSQLSSGADTVSYLGYSFGKRLYLSKTGEGVTVAHHSVLTYFGTKHPNQLGPAFTSVKDPNVARDYLNILIPKAVNYAGGLLDYYFRGTFDMGVSKAENADGSDSYTFTARNTSGQDFQNGYFILFQETNGVRQAVQFFPLDGTLANGSKKQFDYVSFDSSLDVTNYVMFYLGTIGVDSMGNPLDPVDAGIAIAIPNSCASSGANPAALIFSPWGPTVGSGTMTTSGLNGNFSVSDGTPLNSRATGSSVSKTIRVTNLTGCDEVISVEGNVGAYFGDVWWGYSGVILNGDFIIGDGGDYWDGYSFNGYTVIPPYSSKNITVEFWILDGLFSGNFSIERGYNNSGFPANFP